MSAIDARYEFEFFIQCVNGNPNGDPDMGNMPRVDPQDMHGFITDVAIKRRIRNYIDIAYAGKPGMNIIMRTSTNINTAIAEARENVGLDASDDGRESIDKARMSACSMFYDVRTFGGVLSTGLNAGQIRGPVQLTFARSVDQILPQDISITRMVAALDDIEKGAKPTYANYKAADAKQPETKMRTMGRKQFIPYGLYEARGFVSANLAAQTGFNDKDLSALFEAILNMYEHDRSASKGMMSVITPVIVFRHEGNDGDPDQRARQKKLGCAPAHKLFSCVSVARKPGVEVARDYTDYDAKIDLSAIPAGVKVGFLDSAASGIKWDKPADGSWICG